MLARGHMRLAISHLQTAKVVSGFKSLIGRILFNVVVRMNYHQVLNCRIFAGEDTNDEAQPRKALRYQGGF